MMYLLNLWEDEVGEGGDPAGPCKSSRQGDKTLAAVRTDERGPEWKQGDKPGAVGVPVGERTVACARTAIKGSR